MSGLPAIPNSHLLHQLLTLLFFRILEADTKSLKSISSVDGRRHSTSSDESRTSMLSAAGGVSLNQQNDNNEESAANDDPNCKMWNLWGHIVNDWEEYSKKNSKQLKVCWKEKYFLEMINPMARLF